MLKKIRSAVAYFSQFDISTLAASTAFFILLSLLPLLTLVLSLLRYLPLTLEDLLLAMERLLPESMQAIAFSVTRDLYSSDLLAVVSLTVVTALWSASRGVYGILCGMNTIFATHDHRSYLRRRLTAMFYTFLMILALFVTLGLQVFGRTLLHIVEGWDFWLLEPVTQLVRLRSLFTAALLALLFSLIFAVFPAKKMRLRDVVPSAVLTAVGWVGFSYLFSIYVDYGGGSRFYGSMATLVLGVLWLYILICILFYGGAVCRLSEENGGLGGALKKFFAPG